jgi:hypothetical protein
MVESQYIARSACAEVAIGVIRSAQMSANQPKDQLMNLIGRLEGCHPLTNRKAAALRRIIAQLERWQNS